MNQSFAKPENSPPAASTEPNAAQKRYLERGLSQPGGKLPLFDAEGRAISGQTVRACIGHGWCEPWFGNPMKPDWLVCRLTVSGYRALHVEPPPPLTTDLR